MRFFNRTDARQSLAVKCGCRHNQHRRVHESRRAHRDDYVEQFEFVESLQHAWIARDDATLGQCRVQINHVRHHRRAEDAAGEQNAFRAAELWHDRVIRDLSPVCLADKCFGDVTQRDHADERGDDRFERTKPVAFETQDHERKDRGEDACREKRHTEQQIKSQRRAEKFRQVGRHRDEFRDDPHTPHDPLWIILAALFRQIQTAGDAEFRGERLNQHRHQVARDDDPQEQIAVLRAPLDVRREIPWVHIRD